MQPPQKPNKPMVPPPPPSSPPPNLIHKPETTTLLDLYPLKDLSTSNPKPNAPPLFDDEGPELSLALPIHSQNPIHPLTNPIHPLTNPPSPTRHPSNVLNLFPLKDLASSSFPPSQPPKPNPVSDEGPNLSLALHVVSDQEPIQPPPKSVSDQQPPPNRKPRKFKSHKPLTEEEVRVLKACQREWDVTSKALPPDYNVSGHLDETFCKLHGWFVDSGVKPDDDFFNHLPTTQMMNRRFNVDDGRYLVYTKRDGVSGDRKIPNVLGKWVERGCWEDVIALDGLTIVGRKVTLCFTFKHRGNDVVTWAAEEFISSDCEEDGDSSVLVLRSAKNWIDVERAVHRAEWEVSEGYWKKSYSRKKLCELKAKLEACMKSLDMHRLECKQIEENYTGAVSTRKKNASEVCEVVPSEVPREAVYSDEVQVYDA